MIDLANRILNNHVLITVDYAMVLVVDLFIGFLVLASIRFLLGFVSHISTHEELSVSDNPAMGISMAGIVVGVGLMIAGILTGDAAPSVLEEAIAVLVSAAVGLVMAFVSRVGFDHLTLPGISVRKELQDQNVAVSILDAANVVSSALVIRGIMVWAGGDVMSVFLWAVIGFVVSQVMLTGITLLTIQWFNRRAKTIFHTNIQNGNTALALRFAGFRIGVAMVISAALNFVAYGDGSIGSTLVTWVVMSGILVMIFCLISTLAECVMLFGIDRMDEVEDQKNIAIGATQAAIAFAFGLAIATLLG